MLYGFFLICLAYAIHQYRHSKPRGRRVAHHEIRDPSKPELDVYGINEAKLAPEDLAFLRLLQARVDLHDRQAATAKLAGGNVVSFKRSA